MKESMFYCSNNFVESFLGETSFVDMEKKSRNEDRVVKQEFSAEQPVPGLYAGVTKERSRVITWFAIDSTLVDAGIVSGNYQGNNVSPSDDV